MSFDIDTDSSLWNVIGFMQLSGLSGYSVYFAAICLQLTAVTSQREWVWLGRNIGQMIFSRCQNVYVINSTCDRQCHEGCYCIIVNTSTFCTANVSHCVCHYNIFEEVAYVFFQIPFYSPCLWSLHLVWWQLLQQKYCHKRVLERINQNFNRSFFRAFLISTRLFLPTNALFIKT